MCDRIFRFCLRDVKRHVSSSPETNSPGTCTSTSTSNRGFQVFIDSSVVTYKLSFIVMRPSSRFITSENSLDGTRRLLLSVNTTTLRLQIVWAITLHNISIKHFTQCNGCPIMTSIQLVHRNSKNGKGVLNQRVNY